MPRRPSPTPRAPAGRRAGALTYLTPLAVAAATIVAFLPALQGAFVTWDDDRNFLANPHYRGLSGEQLQWMWTTFHLGHYVPLSWMTLGLDYTIWGMNPVGYHVTSILLHALNAVLLYFLARQLFSRAAGKASPGRLTLAAAAAALLFALHPLRVESVAWITERRDVLSLAFMLGAVLFYLRWISTGTSRRWVFYSLSIACAAAGLLSKATVMTLPAVLALLNFYPLRRIGGSAGWRTPSARRVYLELVPFALLAAGAVILSVVALDPPPQLSLGNKVVVSAYSLAFYLWKTLAPTDLGPLYQMPWTIVASDPRFIAGLVVAALYATALVISARRNRAVFAALAAFLVLVLPMLGVVQNGPQIAADRYTYHASPALSLLAGSLLLVASARWLAPLAGAAGLVLALLAALTWNQALVWRDSATLWERVATVDPQSSIAQSSIASLLFDQDRIEEAAAHSVRALELDPGSTSAHTASGMALARTGHAQDAVTEYQRAIELSPLNDQAENDWGIVLAQSGDATEAIRHYQRALFVNPDNAGAQVNWGAALVRLGKFAEAIPHFQESLAIRPGNADAYLNWGVALAREGNYRDAVTQFRAALAINPDHAEARDYLAKASALVR